MTPEIAIIGMACRYPDASSPGELWKNVLAQRSAFRRIPDERLFLDDYLSTDREAPDSFYSANAAFIEGYEFDRVRFKVPHTTFRSADMAHWLALDIASQALDDASFSNAEGLPRATTGVFLGNTLTGEFSRAETLRLRWPYVRRVLEACLMDEECPSERRHDLLKNFEHHYKKPFSPITEESLAGSLSNTIAGRICNHFGLQGGGYVLDGACASSLLAVANACTALTVGDVDAALAGGVDLSIDPFELVGFAKAGALATDLMRIYDEGSNGFWPGEGCGFVVLMRREDALARSCRIYAVIKGWGISSNGDGGITRPEISGQLLCLERAYRRAGFGIETVGYFEGHGTGTAIGDTVELKALSQMRREATKQTPPAAIGSIKANIGHTKAAAGIAGLINATMALHSRILPPTTGCYQPHHELNGAPPVLRVLRKAESWSNGEDLRAGVSSFGFGGINTHVTLEADATAPLRLSETETQLILSAQDAELFVLSADSAEDLQREVERLLRFSSRLSRAELSDLAAELARTLTPRQIRAAIVASDPSELTLRLESLKDVIEKQTTNRIDASTGFFLGTANAKPRVGFLFPGQGTPANIDGGIWRRRFASVSHLYEQAQLRTVENSILTSVSQPAIVTASLSALHVLSKLNISAQIAVGHSLGEITALSWAGAFDDETLLRIATTRGEAMMAIGGVGGTMFSIAAGADEVAGFLNGEPVRIAAVNSPRQTVISGEANAVANVAARARSKKLMVTQLPVSHAFHSPLVAGAGPVLVEFLNGQKFGPLQRRVVSTVSGKILTPEIDVRSLLYRQITSPVLFMSAASKADSEGIDLWLEVGPGHTLSRLVAEITDTPVIALDSGGPSLEGLLRAVAAAFVLGQDVNYNALFMDRFTKPFSLDWQQRRFLSNPCEQVPVSKTKLESKKRTEHPGSHTFSDKSISPLEVITQLVATRAEFPASSVNGKSRLLSDLHLNSITVSQLVTEAAQRLGLPRPVSPTEYADATVAEVAQAFTDQLRTGHGSSNAKEELLPAGIDSWIRLFKIELVEQPLRRSAPPRTKGTWRVLADPEHPLRQSLQRAFDSCEAGHGVVVCLPPKPDERQISLLLEGLRAISKANEDARFVLVQPGTGAASFARTLFLETGSVTCVVNVPPDHPNAVNWVITEALAATRFVEVHYDVNGRRSEPVLRPLPATENSTTPLLNESDVLVVAGGGKGITAECCLALARESGARLVLLGTAQAETDDELAQNLERMAAFGINPKYISVDVTDGDAVLRAIREVEAQLGPVTGIIHGAGRNIPQLLRDVTEEEFHRTVAVKVRGARNLLAAINPDKLRVLVSFGSIIARTGLPGEAHYAVGNEWLTSLIQGWQVEHPHCRCIALEWSIWSDVGMGARLGRIDVLARHGISPIAPDEGVAALRQLLDQPVPSCPVIIMGRLGEMPTLHVERSQLPLLRFLEQPRVFYPSVELVVDVDLSTATDPYLNDHQLRNEKLLPAVMGLEAMGQVATALAGTTKLPAFHEVTFSRPIIISESGQLKIRVAALARQNGLIEVVIRSEETAFQVDHFRATCSFNDAESQPSKSTWKDRTCISLDPERDLYGRILFQRGRFQRLRNYRLLRATECLAEITTDGTTSWFSPYVPNKLLLGDPGARDAALHAVQACIPHKTLIPTGVERISTGLLQRSLPLFLHARERTQDGDTFVYDLQLVDAQGCIAERWEGVRFHAVDEVNQERWSISLFGCYVERRVQQLIPGSDISVAFDAREETDRRAQTAEAIWKAIDQRVDILWRADGKPQVNNHHTISASHTGNLTFAIAGHGPLGCDIEQVEERSAAVWQNLLGGHRLALAQVLAGTTGEDYSTTAARLWTANECLKKAGAGFDSPLLVVNSERDGWVLLSSGRFNLASYVGQISGLQKKLALAVLAQSKNAFL